MKHKASRKFWQRYASLPVDLQHLADKAFALLKQNPSHPSLQFKKVGRYWSARISLTHRCLAVKEGEDFVWIWIGAHDDYDAFLK